MSVIVLGFAKVAERTTAYNDVKIERLHSTGVTTLSVRLLCSREDNGRGGGWQLVRVGEKCGDMVGIPFQRPTESLFYVQHGNAIHALVS